MVLATSLLFWAYIIAPSAPKSPTCPHRMTLMAQFNETAGNDTWIACEDLQTPSGGIVLLSARDEVEWLPKSFEPYRAQPDREYYLGMGKASVLADANKRDVLGTALLSCDHAARPESCFSWTDVERALPPIRNSGNGGHYDTWEACDGVRTFVGSRGTSTDATFSDFGEDCSHNGHPSALGMLLPGYSVINWTAVNTGNAAIRNWSTYINFSAVADGLIGGELPAVVLYFPVLPTNPVHDLGGGSRYWTVSMVPVADEAGRRETDVWFKFTQVDCTTDFNMDPNHTNSPSSTDANDPNDHGLGYGGAPEQTCKGVSQYWENYWWSRSAGMPSDAFGPERSATAAGFYSNLLALRRRWNAELKAEQMIELELPDAGGTNGTWLTLQARHSIVRSMVTRRETWHPSYGVSPGYGWQGQDGFQDVFTSTATMALEFGADAFARGVIDNQFSYYVRHDGLINYRATEVPCVARFLTVLALYFSYTGDAELLLKHFRKAEALAEWLLYRRRLALAFPPTDPRHGIPMGDDEADTYSHVGGFGGRTNPGESFEWIGAAPRMHDLSSAAEASRGFTEIGRVWLTIGRSAGRGEVADHGTTLLAAARALNHDLQASLNRTVAHSSSQFGGQCWAHAADPGCGGWHVRTYPEMLYSGLLTRKQTDDIYRMGAGLLDCDEVRNCTVSNRFLQVGSPAGGTLIFTHIPFGLAYGLLVADMPDRFLLHYYAASAHSYTRGTWTTPESTFVDRDTPSIAYASVGQTIAPIYLKWLLCFEPPVTRTVWIAPALPREWLAPTAAAVVVRRVPTRYGRVGFRLKATETADALMVTANITAPLTFEPPGGLRIRIRAPLGSGKMVRVKVGGQIWTSFDPIAETVDFTANELTSAGQLKRLQNVVVTFKL